MGQMLPPQHSGFDQAKLYLWVKSLESKVNAIVREVDLIKNDFIKKNTSLRQEIKIVGEETLELKRDQEKTLQKMDLIIKELRQTAGIEEVLTLKKYLEFWNPLHFVTQRDLERLVEIKMEEQNNRKQEKDLKPKGDTSSKIR